MNPSQTDPDPDQLAAELERIRAWNALLRPAVCAWPTCPIHGLGARA